MRNFCQDPISNWWCDYQAPPLSLCLKETASDLSSSHTLEWVEWNFCLWTKAGRMLRWQSHVYLLPLSPSCTCLVMPACVCLYPSTSSPHTHTHPYAFSLSPPLCPGNICTPGLCWCNCWVTHRPHRVCLAAQPFNCLICLLKSYVPSVSSGA